MTAPAFRSAIIVAAGHSQRMGFDKITALLRDRPVLWYSLEAFSKVEGIKEIIVVASSDHFDAIHAIASEFPKCHAVVRGGEHRVHSVLRGLEALGAHQGFVAIHDASRPLITPAAITKAFECAQEYGAAACAEPLNDTIHKVDESGRIERSLDRSHLWRMQTPQVFPPHEIHEVLRLAVKNGSTPTDEAGAYAASGKVVHICPNLEANFKLTFPTDLVIAEAILAHRHNV